MLYETSGYMYLYSFLNKYNKMYRMLVKNVLWFCNWNCYDKIMMAMSIV